MDPDRRIGRVTDLTTSSAEIDDGAARMPTTRMQRLRAATAPLHERLDGRIMQHRPFAGAERYAAFLRGQLALALRLEPAYRDPRLARCFPGLAERCRLAAILADLRDIGAAASPDAADGAPIGFGEAVGWLYVSEGSTLGAAFLLKEVEKIGFGVDHGGRHLAPHADGRGLHWRRFVEQLEAAPLDERDEATVAAGAEAAFAHVSGAFEAEFRRL